jgi:hypothetical protein
MTWHSCHAQSAAVSRGTPYDATLSRSAQFAMRKTRLSHRYSAKIRWLELLGGAAPSTASVTNRSTELLQYVRALSEFPAIKELAQKREVALPGAQGRVKVDINATILQGVTPARQTRLVAGEGVDYDKVAGDFRPASRYAMAAAVPALPLSMQPQTVKPMKAASATTGTARLS